MREGKFLSGNLALVTGGSKGIGKTVAGRLLRLGARVMISGRRPADLETAAAELRTIGPEVGIVAADVASEEGVATMFAALDRMGSIDILINNAGIAVTKPFLELSAAEFDTVQAINMRGAFLCCQEAVRRMREKGGGRIVNIASASSLRSYVNEGAYAASKHGMLAIAKSVAFEFQKDGIVVQTICPNAVATEMAKIVRPDLDESNMVAPEDVADAVEFLLNQNSTAFTDILTLRRKNNIPYPC